MGAKNTGLHVDSMNGKKKGGGVAVISMNTLRLPGLNSMPQHITVMFVYQFTNISHSIHVWYIY